MELDDQSLQVLSCEISLRPGNAAGIAHVLPYVRYLKADGNKVIVQFDQEGKAAVESFVGAERLCCTSLTWELSDVESALQLTIVGTAAQAGVIKKWFEDSRAY